MFWRVCSTTISLLLFFSSHAILLWFYTFTNNLMIIFTRKALNLIQYLLQENNSDCNIVKELGFPRIMMHLASSEDSDVREAALGGLLEIARDRTSESNAVLAEEDKLKQVLQDRIEGISSMTPEDLGAAREERQLVDSLWNACYNEPSSLRDKGLVVLPGEDTSQPPPDVAGKFFEPPLRAWTAKPPSEERSDSDVDKKKTAPLLLGAGPSGGS